MHAPSIVSSLKDYNRKTFLSDLGAGLTVGVVALPLAMAFAIACGSSEITPATGLITAVVAGFLISLLGGSKFQIGGPTGAFVVLISGVVGSFGFSGLVLCTLLAGLFLIIFGVCRMGSLIKFIPYPVTTGFTSGIAITIFCTQVKDRHSHHRRIAAMMHMPVITASAPVIIPEKNSALQLQLV